MNITNLSNIKFKPYNRNNLKVSGLNWHVISYDNKTSMGTYILEYKPGAKTPEHTHMGYEEFLILEGELINSCGKTFTKNMFVSYKPNTKHYTYSIIGCKVLVFSRGENKTSKL